MRAIGTGLDHIAEAFKVARSGGSNNNEMISSMKELTQMVQTQTQALNKRIRVLAAKSCN
ncbi:hypothetical protein PR003_g14852 [Phytophthora rubi]|uniref:HTH merR-type domain-containing protein n=1 Tax=Phytophthora rubi TaxID=129364 RepID=A0A6A4EY70_9STRA|nr:hypothetical protein PR003_g14852 [Phytophthora rubi]